MKFQDLEENQDQDLEEKVVEICKDSDIEIPPIDIEDCHRLHLRRNATNTMKRFNVKFVKRKHSKAMF